MSAGFLRDGANEDSESAGDGPLLTLTAQVVDTSCNPIPYSWVAIWHTEPAGDYDNVAPFDHYRGWFFTDANGEFTLYTIVPGLYPGRTRHLHVKVDAPHTNVLTTQLYFAGDPYNDQDPFIEKSLIMQLTDAPGGAGAPDQGKAARFDFVLRPS